MPCLHYVLLSLYVLSLDNVDQLIPGFIQHGGDNVLPTVQAYIYDKIVDSVITSDEDYELGL